VAAAKWRGSSKMWRSGEYRRGGERISVISASDAAKHGSESGNISGSIMAAWRVMAAKRHGEK